MSTSSQKARAGASRPWLAALPIAGFAALAALFYMALFSGNPANLPSALIGKPVPAFALGPLENLKIAGRPVPGLSSAYLKRGKPSVVNVWASWCGPCRLEHPFLMQLAKRGDVQVTGINYKDVTENARRFLAVHGNPFEAVGVDPKGSTALDWGVYGVPETFVVDANGVIVLKHIGPITKAALETNIIPAIRKSGGR